MLQGMTTYSTRSDWLCSFTINEFTLSFLTKFSKKGFFGTFISNLS
jgi:hypothetical protein